LRSQQLQAATRILRHRSSLIHQQQKQQQLLQQEVVTRQ
jgi:hypothetical protein